MKNSIKPTTGKKVVKFIAYLIAVSLVIGFSFLALTNISQLEKTVKETQIKLDEKNSEVKKLQTRWDKINEELNKLKKDNSSSQDKIKELEQQKQQLELQLQAKVEQKAKIAAAAEAERKAQASQKAQVTARVSGTCADWMAQAGITDQANAAFIFQKESGCNPNAVNASSKAHGVCQSLPGNKMASAGADWYTNPVTQMRWCQSYAISRYGSWAKAVAFWQANRWW